jgi:aerotolerance regulator-like protein/VWA domain-containing protein
MSFLAPMFLLGAAVAAVPIVLHLLKRDPESRVKFAVVRLLKRAPVEHTQRHRLRELLLLALRVAALLLLALAFARPFLASGAALGSVGATIVALDTSYSLSAPGRFAIARQLAKDAIARADRSDLIGIVVFADEAEVVVRPSADRVLAASAVDRAQPGFGATRYRAALSAAAQALAGRRGTIVVVTDLQETGWDAGDRVSIPDTARVEIADVGALPPNLAVTAVATAGDRVTATIRNAGPAARDVRARLTVDGRPAGTATAALGPNQSAEVAFPAASGTTAAVAVDDPDGIEADNVRYTVLDAAKRPSILIVSGDGDRDRDAFYTSHALAAGGAVAGYAVDARSGARLSAPSDRAAGAAGSKAPDTRLDSYAAVVLLSTRGLERRGREALASYVRTGGGLFVAAGPDIDAELVADVLGPGAPLRIATADAVRSAPRTLAPSDVRHPLFRPFAGGPGTLALVKFQSVARVEGAGCETLARFSGGEPALIECAAGDGRALVLASDLENRWNDFPLHASFVPFLHEAVRYLSGSRPRASEYVVADAPAGVPRRPGVHPFRAPDGTTRPVAVNVDPREADPARLTVQDFQSAVMPLKDLGAAARLEARQQEDRQHLWQYALAMMLVALACEGFLAGRTA